MNGKPKNPVEAMLAAQQRGGAMQQQNVNPVQLFAQYFGFNAPTLQQLQPNVTACMCGRCQGIGVQLEVRLHFPLIGPPEFITRGDAAKAAPENEKPTEKAG